MRKTVEIAGKSTVLDNNASILLKYKAEFGADIFADYTELVKTINKPFNDTVGLTVIRLTYIMAKAADKGIAPFEEWVESLESFPLTEMTNIVIDMMMRTLEIRSEKNSTSPATEETTGEN